MQQSNDFLEESICLSEIILPLSEDKLNTVTQFKNWTIIDIVGHLHMFNHAAELALQDAALFREFFAPMAHDLNQGKSLLEVQNDWLKNVAALELVDMWVKGFRTAAKRYATADPKQRIAWAGPDMSARSSITARQMETWAHGQAVFDVLGMQRKDEDRIRNIAHLGVSTFGWTFINRKIDVPSPAPHVKLKAPSGEIWQWNEPQKQNSVEGSAVEFCQVVTQTRALGDTSITCTGKNAESWMQLAQCFAGPPVDGPAKGTRFAL